MTDAIRKLAASISPKTIAACRKRDESVAEANERKYADVRDVEADFAATLDGGITTRYRDIAAGNDNGRCATRAGTYRRYKTGDGRPWGGRKNAH